MGIIKKHACKWCQVQCPHVSGIVKGTVLSPNVSVPIPRRRHSKSAQKEGAVLSLPLERALSSKKLLLVDFNQLETGVDLAQP